MAATPRFGSCCVGDVDDDGHAEFHNPQAVASGESDIVPVWVVVVLLLISSVIDQLERSRHIELDGAFLGKGAT